MNTQTKRSNTNAFWMLLTVVLLPCSVLMNARAAVFELDALGEDLRRAIIVRVTLSPNDLAGLVDIAVANGPPRANFGNPPHILIEYFDFDGAFLGQHHEWDPRWVFEEENEGGHSTEILDEATGTFLVPLSGRLAELRISRLDAEGTPSLLLRVNTVGTVTDFCLQNPTMAICEGFNRPPVADAAGPYNVIIGQAVVLDGSLSTDPEGDTLTYTWDLDGDALFGESATDSVYGNEQGVTPSFSTASIAAPGTMQVALRVCDVFDQCDTDSATVNIQSNPTTGDTDADGIPDSVDLCPGTDVPESVPQAAEGLGRNRWALLGSDGQFVQAPPQSGTTHSFSLADTRGCSCEQIVAAAGLGGGHLKNGCSTSAMLNWVSGL